MSEWIYFIRDAPCGGAGFGSTEPFDVAWPLALGLVGPDLEPWRDPLTFPLPEWRAAHRGEPPVLSFGGARPVASLLSVALAQAIGGDREA